MKIHFTHTHTHTMTDNMQQTGCSVSYDIMHSSTSHKSYKKMYVVQIKDKVLCKNQWNTQSVVTMFNKSKLYCNWLTALISWERLYDNFQSVLHTQIMIFLRHKRIIPQPSRTVVSISCLAKVRYLPWLSTRGRHLSERPFVKCNEEMSLLQPQPPKPSGTKSRQTQSKWGALPVIYVQWLMPLSRAIA